MNIAALVQYARAVDYSRQLANIDAIFARVLNQ
ncbi:hypothetical protein HDF10_002263 [Edaphobacter lichenicola]|uniref:Uncharacterized protein n=1 Tax=Tunturiibacter lichenicola TaxID=2051959 RepID=A0A7W8N3L2_9BACT|nr:hypothetical protein [Edaphobacter lichenicola]